MGRELTSAHRAMFDSVSRKVKGTAAIAISTTQSAAIATDNYVAGTFRIPAEFTGTTVTFQTNDVRDGSGTWVNSYDAGNNQISRTVAVSREYPLPPEVFAAPAFRIVSGSSEGAAREIVYFLES